MVSFATVKELRSQIWNAIPGQSIATVTLNPDLSGTLEAANLIPEDTRREQRELAGPVDITVSFSCSAS